MTYRTGTFGTANAVIGLLGFGAFGALTVLSAVIVSAGDDVAWAVVAGVISLAAAVVTALLAGGGVSTWRSVRITLDPVGDAVLSLPGFTVRRGFYRDVVPLRDVTDARLVFCSQPRNSRWHLVVTRNHGSPISCDSITSSRGPGRDVHDTPAGRAARAIQARIAAANESPADPIRRGNGDAR